MHAGNSSCDSQAKLIIRPVVKWHKFCGNQKIATTLICYIRLMQDSRNALNLSRTVKTHFLNLFIQISGWIWTVVSRGYFSYNSSTAKMWPLLVRVGLNQNLKKKWKGLFQIPFSHIWRMMPYYWQNFTIDWVSFLLQFKLNVMAWLCQQFIFPRCHCFYCL